MYKNWLDYLVEKLFVNPSDDNRLHKFLNPSNWTEADVENRTKFLKFFVDAAGLAVEGLPMSVSRSDFNDAHLKIIDGQILISNKAIRNSRTAFPFIRDYFFQLKFQDQLDYIRGKDIDRMYEREHEHWWHNYNATPANGYERCMLKESDPNYHYQPLVASAHDFADKSIKELARMIYKKNGFLSREIQDFLVGELPNYHIYDNKKKREEISKEIEAKSNFFEKEKYEVWELLMPGSEGVEGLSDEQLLLGLLPPVQMLHELEFDQVEWDKVINRYDYKRFIKDAEHLFDMTREELIKDRGNEIHKMIDIR